MIRIHKDNKELISGSLLKLLAEYCLIAYARFTADEATIVIVNRDSKERMADFQALGVVAEKGAKLERVLFTGKDGFDTAVVSVDTEGGLLRINMPPVSGMVIRTVRKNEREK